MLGDERACPELNSTIAEETCPTTRAIAADALGTFARPSDAPVLIAYLIRYPELAHRRTISRAIARLGPPALAQLLKELERVDLPAIGRAALLDALGWCVAGDQQPPALASILQSANYMSPPTWMVSALTRVE
jgi:HEAT repeat protein